MINLDGTSGILIDVYSDVLYASFVYLGKRFAQSYPHGTSNEKIIKDANDAIDRWIEPNRALVINAKRQAIVELLELHKQDRAKVNSQCDSLINMSTVEKYLRSLGLNFKSKRRHFMNGPI